MSLILPLWEQMSLRALFTYLLLKPLLKGSLPSISLSGQIPNDGHLEHRLSFTHNIANYNFTYLSGSLFDQSKSPLLVCKLHEGGIIPCFGFSF